MRLLTALQGYWLSKKLDLSPNTVRDYALHFKRLTDFLGNPELTDITSDDLRRFLDHIATEHELGKKTLTNCWIALSSFWTWAEIELKVPHIIRGRVKRPKFTTPQIEPLEPGEIKAMLDTAGYTKPYRIGRKKVRNTKPTAERDVAILLTLLDCGLRAQELCDLTIADYDEGRGRLNIRKGKGGKQRFVPLGTRARKALWRYLASREGAKPKDPLFATKTGNHLDRHNLGNLLESIGKNAGVSNPHPHRWRHTFAISYLRAGGNLFVLRDILGHSTLEMVQRYAKIAEQDIAKAVQHSPADNLKL